MSRFGQNIRPFVDTELRLANEMEDHIVAFRHLERAHVLGQASTVQHVRVHWRMLLWGIQNRSWPDCFGQVIRIIGAATKTAFGLVPSGNTGGSNISAFQKLPVPDDLAKIIEEVKSRA